MKVLVTGGTGYIGSHTVVELIGSGHETVIVDDLSNSSPIVIDRIEDITSVRPAFHRVDITDTASTTDIFEREQPDAVIHFASYKAVGESVTNPLKYYNNNLGTGLSVIAAMKHTGCRQMIFSSSATVYGHGPVPLREDQKTLRSDSPYGWSKVMIEQILTDVASTGEINVALLRYFNPVGAHPSGKIGEDPRGIPNNLMPYISQVAAGRREVLTIFGHDYDTPDGTCLRDYLHVVDLAHGHVKALDHIAAHEMPVRAWNLGRGAAVSVLELVNEFMDATGVDVPYTFGPRRPGDLPEVWADPSRARAELGWRAERSVADMCLDTWRWQSDNPRGYEGG